VLQDLRVSVGRTWRFVTRDDTSTVSKSLGGYGRQIDALKNEAGEDGFKLPWPDYRGKFWVYMFGRDYESTATTQLVCGLLPLLSENLINPGPLPSRSGDPFASLDCAEVYLHPFAVTTVVHYSLHPPAGPEEDGQSLPPPGGQEEDDRQAAMLDEFFRLSLAADQPGQVRDGMPLSLLPSRATRDADGNPASYRPTGGGFVLLSGVHDEANPRALAYRLASLYTDTASDKSQPMNSDLSAISVTGGRVAMLLPRRGRTRLECLHHNIAMLLACMENSAAVVGRPGTEAAGWFQQQAALLLNSLYRREPLPGADTIYKSRAAELWIEHRGLADAINQVNARAGKPPPSLP
jgi:hypothetical protein